MSTLNDSLFHSADKEHPISVSQPKIMLISLPKAPMRRVGSCFGLFIHLILTQLSTDHHTLVLIHEKQAYCSIYLSAPKNHTE